MLDRLTNAVSVYVLNQSMEYSKYLREQSKSVTDLTDAETKLQIEIEKTKQEAEKTKQLGIKADYREKHGSHLY